MTRALAAAALALSFPASALAASTWEVDNSHTTAGFEVTHMMVTKVRGHFEKVAGTIEIDDKDVTKSRVDVTIEAASIDTRNDDRDKHLRSADFFDVEKHPNITFKSTKVEKAGKDKLKVTGDLTMRGVTKPVTLDVVYTGKELKNPWGGAVRAASATGKLNRKEWGLEWNKSLEAGGVLVSDEVTLQIDAELNPKKVETAAPAAK